MIAFQVKVEGAKAKGPSYEHAIDELAGAVAEAYATVVRERVSQRGDVAGQFVPPPLRPGAVRGTYVRTGGMWGGLQVIRLGARNAEILFTGTSTGVPVNGRPAAVSNSEKATTILERHGVNVLAMRDDELEAIGDTVTELIARAVGTELPITWSSRLPDGDVVGAFIEAMNNPA